MKTTTRLYDIIYSNYNQLYSDFIDNHQITYFNPELQFSHKVVDYDDEIKTVCRDTIFYGLDFLDETSRLNRNSYHVSYHVPSNFKPMSFLIGS